MTKKLYSLLLALSLMAALPALGMNNNQQEISISCDTCGINSKEASRFRMKYRHTGNIHCYHFFCEKCYGPLSLYDFHHIKKEHPACWWNCKYCAHFLELGKILHITTTTNPSYSGFHKENTVAQLFMQEDGDISTQIMKRFKDYKEPLPKITTTAPSEPILVTLSKPKWLIPIGIMVYVAARNMYTWYKGKDKDAQENDSDVDEEQEQQNEETEPAEQT